MENSNQAKPTDTYDVSYWVNKWKEIRGSLNNNYKLNDENRVFWNTAIEIFSERLQKFYITPINELKKGNKGQGFVIVTAQCALIETFAAFKKGRIYDRGKYDSNKKEKDQIYYIDSGSLFIEFLKIEPEFKDIFCPLSREKIGAGKFYTDVRCGLLHETRTRVDWVIKADGFDYHKKQKKEGKDFNYNCEFIIKREGKIIIFRNQFQKRLENYFDNYKEDLKKSGVAFEELRRLFARKLDHLFDITKDDSFDWWKNEKQSAETSCFQELTNFALKFFYD